MRFSALAFTVALNVGPSTAFSTKSSSPAAVCNNNLRMSTVAEPETATNPLLKSDGKQIFLFGSFFETDGRN